jgi:hypothetical protein
LALRKRSNASRTSAGVQGFVFWPPRDAFGLATFDLRGLLARSTATGLGLDFEADFLEADLAAVGRVIFGII